jgi:hypothetical protein
MRRACLAFVALYAILCVVALLLIPLGAMGLLGSEPDPLSGIFAVLLAMPWTLALSGLMSDTSVLWNLVLAAAGMLLNGLIVGFLCSRLARRAARSGPGTNGG